LKAYINTAPKFRLEFMTWVIIGEDTLIIGSPALPIPGVAYWTDSRNLIPAGYILNYYALRDVFNEKFSGDTSPYFLWDVDQSFTKINRNDFAPLTIGSFNKTMSI
jgi:hypothetical protein